MLRPPSPDDCQRILEVLTDAGYTYAGLKGCPNLTERASRRYGTVKYLLESTAEPSAFNTLVRWFTIGVPVPCGGAADVLPSSVIDLFLESGMLRRIGDALEPYVMLSPLGGMLVASDPVLKWEDDPADLVVWPNPTTEQLLNFTIRQPFRSALDLGCGCGVQALAAATHCESVFATDLNSRAAEFTAFNARLNGYSNVRCGSGDAFDPVTNCRFELIVANPPFFIAPFSGLTYCENNFGLDLFCRRIVREAPEYLNDRGFFQMVCEWVEVEGQPWRERIAEWVDGIGCDAWVIKQYSMTPSGYGSERSHQRPPGDEHRFFENWIAYAHENRISGIHGGLVTIRKRTGANWLRIDNDAISLHSPVGDLIAAGFASRDVLDAHPDRSIEEIHPRLSADTRLVQLLGQSGDGWNQQSLRLHLTGSMPRQIDVAPVVAQFIARFDGNKTLGDLIRELAESSRAPIETVARESIAVTRKLLAEGYLEA